MRLLVSVAPRDPHNHAAENLVAEGNCRAPALVGGLHDNAALAGRENVGVRQVFSNEVGWIEIHASGIRLVVPVLESDGVRQDLGNAFAALRWIRLAHEQPTAALKEAVELFGNFSRMTRGEKLGN